MKALTFAVMILVSLSGCIRFSGSSYTNTDSNNDNRYVNLVDIPSIEYINVTYSHDLESELGLFLQDSYVTYDDFIEKSYLYYRSERLLDMCQARDMIVYLVEGYLARINEHETLKSDLYSYPFTADNLLIHIEFDSFYGEYIDRAYVGRVVIDNGCVYYYDYDGLCQPECWQSHSERYDQSYRLSKAYNRCNTNRKRTQHNFFEQKGKYNEEDGILR